MHNLECDLVRYKNKVECIVRSPQPKKHQNISKLFIGNCAKPMFPVICDIHLIKRDFLKFVCICSRDMSSRFVEIMWQTMFLLKVTLGSNATICWGHSCLHMPDEYEFVHGSWI